jgi:hypothetical protein
MQQQQNKSSPKCSVSDANWNGNGIAGYDGTNDGGELAGQLREQHILLYQEEFKPFKCLVIGCEIEYKTANGLEYHKQVCITRYIAFAVTY